MNPILRAGLAGMKADSREGRKRGNRKERRQGGGKGEERVFWK